MLNHKLRYSIVSDSISSHLSGICEIGSGSKGLGEYFPNVVFTGVDKDFEDYGSKLKTVSKNMNAVKCDATKLPFENSSFDFVFSLDMIEHLDKKTRLLAITEMIRISRKNVIIAFPCGRAANNSDKFMRRTFKFFGRQEPGWLTEHLTAEYPAELEIANCIAANGYDFETSWQESIATHNAVQMFEILSLGTSIFDKFIPFSFARFITRLGRRHYRAVFHVKK